MMVGFVEGIRNRERQRMCWLDNIWQWNALSVDSLLATNPDRQKVSVG